MSKTLALTLTAQAILAVTGYAQGPSLEAAFSQASQGVQTSKDAIGKASAQLAKNGKKDAAKDDKDNPCAQNKELDAATFSFAFEPKSGQPKKEIKFTFQRCIVVDLNFDDIRGEPLEAVRVYAGDVGRYELMITTKLGSDHSGVSINQYSGPDYPRDEYSTGYYGTASFGGVETRTLLSGTLADNNISLADYSGRTHQEQTGKGTFKKIGS